MCSKAFSTCAIPAYLYAHYHSSLVRELTSVSSAVFGPKLGMRAMVQSRFAWGCVSRLHWHLALTNVASYYGAVIPSTLNVISCQGYLIANTIIGGQTLGSVSPHVGSTIGIIIIALVTLLVVFSGYRVVHW